MSHRGGRKEPEKRRTGIQRYKARVITRWAVTIIAAAAAIALVFVLLH